MLQTSSSEFRYKSLQTPVEVTFSQPRKFNVLEEFILRASIEFVPTPSVKELAQILGLDVVFVQSTVENLKSLNSLEVSSTGSILITPQGREFYKQGTFTQPPQTKQIYAIADPFAEHITFHFDLISEPVTDLPTLEDILPLESITPDLHSLTISEIQQLIQASGLGLHVPEHGKNVTDFNVAGESQNCWKTVSISVLQDLEEKYTIQVKRGKQILEKASSWLTELQREKKVSLDDLCQSRLQPDSQPLPKSPTKSKRTKKKVDSPNPS